MRLTIAEAAAFPLEAAQTGERAYGAARLALISLAVIGILYVIAALSLPADALTHHDEGAKYLQVRNLRVTPSGLDWSINYPARHLDPTLKYVPFQPKQHYVDSRGRIYLQWPIFLGLLTRLFWKLLGFGGLYVVPLLAGLGTIWASYRLALAVGADRRSAWLAVPLVGLTTPIALFSLIYFEHTLASLLVVLSMLASVRSLSSSAQNTRMAGLGGALLAVAVYFRSELYVLALVTFLVYAYAGKALRNGRLPLVWLVMFGAALVPLWGFYAITEGTLLPTHALWYFAGGEPAAGGIPKPGLPPLRYIATAGWGVIPAFLFGPETAPLAPRFPLWVEVPGLLGVGICALAAIARGLVRTLSGWTLPAFGVGMGLLLVSTAVTLLSPQPYYNLHGFVLAVPFVVLALWPPTRPQPNSGIPGTATKTPIAAKQFLYAVTLPYVVLHALIISALSGLGPISLHEWGQRYLLPAYPLLIVLALAASADLLANKQRMPGRAVVALGAVLCLVGAGFLIRGYGVLHEERTQVESWLHLVRQLPTADPVVTDVWWLPLNLAADFYSRPFMLAEGDTKLREWTNNMRAEGVSRFSMATNDPTHLQGAWTQGANGPVLDGPPLSSGGLWVQHYTLSK